MLVVINRETCDVVFEAEYEFDSSFDIHEVFPKYQPNSMQYAWYEGEELPEYFKVNDDKIISLTLVQAVEEGFLLLEDDQEVVNDKVVTLTPIEMVKSGRLKLGPKEKIVNGEVVQKSLKECVDEGIIIINEPFEFINNNDEIERRSLTELVDGGLIETNEDAETMLNILNKNLEKEIKNTYSSGYEMKVIKNCLDWVIDGQPEDDSRVVTYTKMRSDIEKVKERYADMRNKIKSKLIKKA